MIRSTLLKTGAASIVLAAAVTACGSKSSSTATPAGGSESASPTMTTSDSAAPAAAADPTATQGATLRADLDTLFRQHVNLTVFVVQTAVKKGLTAPATGNAVQALTANTTAIANAIGSLYGAAAQAEFTKQWTEHIGYFVNYTKGLATHDATAVSTAQAQLQGYITNFGKFLGGATGLPASAVSADLSGHVQTLELAIKDIVTDAPAAGADIQSAAAHMDGTAAVVASGIAKTKNLTGATDSAAAGLRATLNGLLIQHAADTIVVVNDVVRDGLGGASTGGAVAALGANTDALTGAISSLYGAAAASSFKSQWAAHIGFFVNYAKAVATHQSTAAAEAQLAGYVKNFGTFLGTATGLPPAAVSADLQGHVQSLEQAITAILTGDPTAGTKVSAADDHMAGTAAVLAKAIAAQKKLS